MTDRTLTLTLSEREVEVLIEAITTSLNDSRRDLALYQGKTDTASIENVQIYENANKELTDLYNKIWNSPAWSN